MHCPPDLLAWHNDQWLAMSVHDAKLYSLNPKPFVLGAFLILSLLGPTLLLRVFDALNNM